MAFNRNPKSKQYSSLSSDERIALAISTGATGSKNLTTINSVLAATLRFYGEMPQFLNAIGNTTAEKIARTSPNRDSRVRRYRGLTDDELLAKIRSSEKCTSVSLLREDSVIYAEVMRRPSLRVALVSLGWRRPQIRYENMTTDDWVAICSKFDSNRSFQEEYSAAYNKS